MRKQFDIIVYPVKEIEPPIEDPALEWFPSLNVNEALPNTTAEWIIIIHHDINISREHLNQIAQACNDFPMIDCFAPSLYASSSETSFASAYVIDILKGPVTIDLHTRDPFEYVAASSPYLMVVSRRIIQRTGAFDLDLSLAIRFIDLGLRMYHAGGKIFSIPLSPVELKNSSKTKEILSINEREWSLCLFKNMGIKATF
ncbi:MAG TPA: hypothetical protein PK366_09545, partial [Fibrobacteraceae bacterium]|nr:hypothetical protein [Fibrobacteraceae bacterium]